MMKLLVPFLSLGIFFLLLSFGQTKGKKKSKGLSYSFIPSGNIERNGETKSIQSFIISEGEVTNFHWLEFLQDLKAKGDIEKLAICAVDSTKWNINGLQNTELVNHYFDHPAYRDYPVVNITKEAAELYCEWLSDRFLPNREEGAKKLIFRLPTHEEWIYAAKGGLKTGEYSWGGPYVRNEKGMILANFTRYGSEHISRDEEGNLIVVKSMNSITCTNCNDVLAPSTSYWPNGYGLYNMNGNVAEMIAEKNIVVGGSWKDPGYDIRNESYRTYEGAAPNVGFRVIATAKGEDVPWLKVK